MPSPNDFFQTNFIRLGAKHYWDFHCNQPIRIGHFHSVSLWNGFTVKAIGCLIIAIIIYNLRLENCCCSMWLIASDYPLRWHCGAKLYKIQYINTTTNENGSAFYRWRIITLVDIYMRLIRFPNCYLASSVLLTWEPASASLSTISPMVKPRGEITIPDENPFSNDSYTKLRLHQCMMSGFSSNFQDRSNMIQRIISIMLGMFRMISGHKNVFVIFGNNIPDKRIKTKESLCNEMTTPGFEKYTQCTWRWNLHLNVATVCIGPCKS